MKLDDAVAFRPMPVRSLWYRYRDTVVSKYWVLRGRASNCCLFSLGLVFADITTHWVCGEYGARSVVTTVVTVYIFQQPCSKLLSWYAPTWCIQYTWLRTRRVRETKYWGSKNVGLSVNPPPPGTRDPIFVSGTESEVGWAQMEEDGIVDKHAKKQEKMAK